MKEYRRFSLTNQKIGFRRIKALVLTLMLLFVFFTLGTSNNGEKNIYAILTASDTIDFDLAYGNVEIGVLDGASNYIYQGYDSTGTIVSGIHADTNKYLVTQSNSEVVTNNQIILRGFSTKPLYDVTLSGINCASEANCVRGGLLASAVVDTPMEIILRLQNDNYIGRLHYATGEASETSLSSLYITSALGDGFTEGMLTANSTSTWSAAIGGVDATDQEASRNITIAGGTIYASANENATSYSGTSAIGGGGNGAADVLITGGNVTAINCGTGATIGGGGGNSSPGGIGNVTITGGNVTAINNYSSGVAIGAGGSRTNIGNNSTVTISGGTVTTTGNIGGGSSNTSAAGAAIVNISGGTVLVNEGTISGGNSINSNGGPITVNITGGNITASAISGGTGSSGTATGNVLISGGSINVETLGENTTVVDSEGVSVSMRAITIPNINEVTLVTNIAIEDGNGDAYLYGSDVYTDENGNILLWLPTDCIVKSVEILVDGIEHTVIITSNAAAYTVIVPDGFVVNDNSGFIEVSALIQNYLPSQQIQITLSLTACSKELKLFDASMITLSYSLYKDSNHTQAINQGDILTVFSNNGTHTTRIYYTVDDQLLYSGSYSDTLTFNIAVDIG